MPATDRSVDVLLVGGGVASVRCARTLRRHGFDGSVLIVGDEDRPPYNRPPLSKELLRDDLPDELLAAEPASWYARRSIDLLTNARVTAIDPDAGRASLADGSTIRFERCLLATGAALRRLSIPGADQALMLRTAADARRMRAAAVAAPPGSPVVVIGGGFIGLEVASALATHGLRPTVVEMATSLWGGTLGIELAAWASDRLTEIGVELRLGTAVSRLADGAAWLDEDRLPATFAVAGIGVVPREDLAETAGIAVADGILVGADQRTSHPAVWAAGDVARVDGRRVEHWHAAREAGERAGLSMLGLPLPPCRPRGSSPRSRGRWWTWSVPSTAGTRSAGSMPDRLIGYLGSGRLVGLASIDNALAVEIGRRLVADRALPEEATELASR